MDDLAEGLETCLSNFGLLSEWEQMFVTNIQRRKRLSKKQLYWLGKTVENVEKLLNKEQTFHVYVLELQLGYFYVGQTRNLTRRLTQHMSGCGSEVTKLIPVVKLAKAYTVTKAEMDDKENLVTAEYMLRFGFDKVRGGVLAAPKHYSEDEVKRFLTVAVKKGLRVPEGVLSRYFLPAATETEFYHLLPRTTSYTCVTCKTPVTDETFEGWRSGDNHSRCFKCRCLYEVEKLKETFLLLQLRNCSLVFLVF